MPTLCEQLPASKAASGRDAARRLPALRSGVTAVGQHTCSPELTEALQMRDKQYFLFHPDVDYEPGKRKLKR